MGTEHGGSAGVRSAEGAGVRNVRGGEFLARNAAMA